MKTVKDIEEEMYSHQDVGLAIQVRNAISGAIKNGKITLEDKLSTNVLGEIRFQIYENNRKLNPNLDPTTTLFSAMAGKTNNPVETALQYIEDLFD